MDQEVELLVSELQCSFEARVNEEMKLLTDKVADLSTSLTDSQIHQRKLEDELLEERAHATRSELQLK